MSLGPPTKLPRLTDVAVVRPAVIHAIFDDGVAGEVDLTTWISDYPEFAPLAEPAMFATLRIANWGSTAAWGDLLDNEKDGPVGITAKQLWRMVLEQRRWIFSPSEFRVWREEQRLSLSGAAKRLGISRRMVSYYDDGSWPVPRTVTLACVAIGTRDLLKRFEEHLNRVEETFSGNRKMFDDIEATLVGLLRNESPSALEAGIRTVRALRQEVISRQQDLARQVPKPTSAMVRLEKVAA